MEKEDKLKEEINKIIDPIFNKVLKEARKEGKLKKITADPDFKFSVINAIKLGIAPSKLAERLGMKLGHLEYYLKPFKIVGILVKKGYGTWGINEQKYQEFLQDKDVKKSSAVANSQLPKSLTSKPIRGHGFQFTLKIPKLENWDKRSEFLKKNSIDFKPIGSNWKGQRIIVRGHKVWLTPVSIVIYAPKYESWFATTAEHSRSHAIYDFLQLVRSIENLLKASLEIKKQHWFRVSRQHYGLVKNSLAIQYDKEDKKLYISNPKGQWFVIDNSYNLHEAETLSPESANKDMDNVVKPLFDDLDSLQVKHKDFFGEPENAKEILNDAKDHFDSTGEILTLSKVLAVINKDIEGFKSSITGTLTPVLNKINDSIQLEIYNKQLHQQVLEDMSITLNDIRLNLSKTPPQPQKKPIKAKKYGLSDEEIEIIKKYGN